MPKTEQDHAFDRAVTAGSAMFNLTELVAILQVTQQEEEKESMTKMYKMFAVAFEQNFLIATKPGEARIQTMDRILDDMTDKVGDHLGAFAVQWRKVISPLVKP